MALSKNTRAVVTGGASGIGRAFSLALGKRHGKVLVADIDENGARETAKLVEAAGGTASVTRCDVTRVEDVERLAREADERFGGADLVINNAGVAVGGLIGEVPLENWRWLTDINFWGVVYGCHVFVPRFRAQGSGHVINVASAAGLLAAAQMGPYNASKAAVIAISETLAGELHGTGVGVSVLCPTFIRTNIGKSSRGTDEKLSALIEKLMERGKLSADEVAEMTLDAADRGELYVVPQEDGRWAWRLKRMNPESFYRKFAPEVAAIARNPDGVKVADVAKALVRALTPG